MSGRLPQDLSAVKHEQITGTLAGKPGLRLARSVAARASKVYTGTGPSPQRFVKQADATKAITEIHRGTVPVGKRRTLASRNLGPMG